MTYRVRIDCTNDITHKSYEAGDIITPADFPQNVIDAWLTTKPPVLEVYDGRDA